MIINHLKTIKYNINTLLESLGEATRSVDLLIATKKQPTEKIRLLLEAGHSLFGENQVVEAYRKWPYLKQDYPKIELHLIGHLQTNKVKDAISLFDVIQTLDSMRLADKLHEEECKQKKHRQYYIEINIGDEPQKTGVRLNDFDSFFNHIKKNTSLDVKGIMCIPPYGKNPVPYFQRMKEIAQAYELKILSMGMTEDYELAIQEGSTLVRIGRGIFN